MSAPTLQLAARAPAIARRQARALTVCHFTVAHAELKSRTFHRELLPLAGLGINVRYIAPMKPAGTYDRVEFVPLQRRQSRLQRILTAIGLLPLLLRQNASLYHFQDPELFPAAFALKLIFRKRVVYDAYEDFPALVAGKKSLSPILRSLAAKLVGSVEALAARCFDGLLTADASTLRRLAPRARSRTLVFYNFPNLEFFPNPQPSCAKSFDVVYRGGLSARAGTMALLDAMALLASERRHIRLLLLGYFDDADAEAGFRRKIRTLGLGSNVEVRGRVPHEEMAAALGSARIGVSPLLPVPKFLTNIPVKIFEYWACGLPVVATDLPPMRPFFRQGEGGVLVSPSHRKELARTIAQSIGWLLDHPETAQEMGQRGRALVIGRFNNAAEVPKLRRFCERISAW
jgi:glycosyltransferase involved in cell wall biosynthesis